MECASLIESAVKKGDISSKLFKGSTHKDLVIDLQRTLFELGFSKQLKWDKYQADGSYGPATCTAISDFGKKNNFQTDGKVVTKELAELILQRHHFLPSMYLLWDIHRSDLRTRKYISKGTKTSIIAIQVLLNTLGYRNSQTGAKLKEDGLYGRNTQNAMIAFAQDNDIHDSDGDWLRRPLINLLIENINPFYGKDWSKLAASNLPNDKSPLVFYEGSRFEGKPCRADIQFVPMLETINSYAEQADVFVHVTSSFRTTINVQGAIVKPAVFSNHLAGHGIDMNLRYEGGFANSTELIKFPNVDEPVRRFLQFIIDDPILRWGGKFNTVDPVHIDDWLNKDKDAWEKRYFAMQKAVQLGE